MPILSHHHVLKALGDLVDHRNDLVTVFNCHAAAGQVGLSSIGSAMACLALVADLRRLPWR